MPMRLDCPSGGELGRVFLRCLAICCCLGWRGGVMDGGGSRRKVVAKQRSLNAPETLAATQLCLTLLPETTTARGPGQALQLGVHTIRGVRERTRQFLAHLVAPLDWARGPALDADGRVCVYDALSDQEA